MREARGVKYHQMRLDEFGIITEDLTSKQKQIHKRMYACPCGGCICNHCANSVECVDHCTGEAEFGCFSCDECKHFDGKIHTDNWKTECDQYKVTEAYVARIRKNFSLVTMEAGKEK